MPRQVIRVSTTNITARIQAIHLPGRTVRRAPLAIFIGTRQPAP
jgi:hypothetical protein